MFQPSSSSAPNYSGLSMHHEVSFSSALPTAPTEIPRGGFFHDNGGLFVPNVAASAPPPYPSSLPSYYIHRNTSSHFLPLHHQLPDPLSSNATFSCSSPSACQLPLHRVPSSPSSSSGDLLEFSTGAMRRVFSTGDLQVMNVSPSPPPPLSGDTHSQDAGGAFTQKVGRYSAEERKEKIERYRIKRQQRNFHKKITYACRKTLADSRPRVQGRFARNIETEAEAVAGHEQEASDNIYEQCSYSNLIYNSSNCYDNQCRESGKSTTFDDGKWWWEIPVATAANEHHGHHHYQQLLGFDVDDDEDELWASLADMCSGT
ncbi:two-component response regulator-like APRR1 [Phragmites australis]|uniref:two-component response regulator-like APRR1 n=1 Tax=Phragmites australis TaxID=29695 RepID=UPI002D775B57|nr:two-component response regulator-like APRR1 [Phragmites australis]